MLDICPINPVLIFVAAVIVEIALIIIKRRELVGRVFGFTLVILCIMMWATYMEYNQVLEDRIKRSAYEIRVMEFCMENSTFMQEFKRTHQEIPESRIESACREYLTFDLESGVQEECGIDAIKLTTYIALIVSVVVLLYAVMHNR